MWDAKREPNYKAYARALDSPEGQLLYAARERAPKMEPAVRVQKREEPITKAERKIHKLAAEYMVRHPGVTRERAVIKVLERNPELHTRYLRQCG